MVGLTVLLFRFVRLLAEGCGDASPPRGRPMAALEDRPEGFRRVAHVSLRGRASACAGVARDRRAHFAGGGRCARHRGRPDRQEHRLPPRGDDAAVLVIASGDRRVDEEKVAAIIGPLGAPMRPS